MLYISASFKLISVLNASQPDLLAYGSIVIISDLLNFLSHFRCGCYYICIFFYKFHKFGIELDVAISTPHII